MPAPPAILLAWCEHDRRWTATAILAETPLDLTGPSTAGGADPSAALNALLAKRFRMLSDSDYPATLVAFERVEEFAR